MIKTFGREKDRHTRKTQSQSRSGLLQLWKCSFWEVGKEKRFLGAGRGRKEKEKGRGLTTITTSKGTSIMTPGRSKATQAKQLIDELVDRLTN
jgi:hypothetical protein